MTLMQASNSGQESPITLIPVAGLPPEYSNGGTSNDW
jgi:hypothetical protein